MAGDEEVEKSVAVEIREIRHLGTAVETFRSQFRTAESAPRGTKAKAALIDEHEQLIHCGAAVNALDVEVGGSTRLPGATTGGDMVATTSPAARRGSGPRWRSR